MTRPRSGVRLAACALLLAACAHTDAFVAPPPPSADGPFAAGEPTRLTYNADADLNATWTPDGQAILYTFADPTRPDRDRCLGMLRATGGTRIRTICDERPGHADSVDYLAAPALSAGGKLLYIESTSPRGVLLPQNIALHLADTAAPFVRRTLVTFPIQLGGGRTANWLTNVTWIGEDQFIAMARDFTVLPRCPGCGLGDTVYNPMGIVRGTVPATGAATIAPIPGTDGYGAFAVAENGAQLILAAGSVVSKMPIGGGAATVLTTLGSGAVDIACRNTSCVALTSSQGSTRLERFATTPGAATLIVSGTGWRVASASPGRADVVVTDGPRTLGDLLLFHDVLP